MSSRRPAQPLRDILENIDAIVDFTTGMTLVTYMRDRKTRYAVTRALEIISEASRRLPDALKTGIRPSTGRGLRRWAIFIGTRMMWSMRHWCGTRFSTT
jgi:uncharacterized protein with HEPN domain